MRNPYLLLGIDYASNVGDAKRAFARAARELKRGSARKSFERADLSWALNEVERELDDPEGDPRYLRVPANPNLYESSGSGLFAPSPYVPPRQTDIPTKRPARSEITVPTPYDVVGEALIQGLAQRAMPEPYPQLKENT